MKSAWLEVEDGRTAKSVNLFLSRLLQEGLLQGLLLNVELSGQGNVAPALVTDPEICRQACPLAPVMPVSLAMVVSRLTRLRPSEEKLGVVLRSCELRALVELVKLKQASLQNLVLIGFDCYGTFSPEGYREFCKTSPEPAEVFLRRAAAGESLDLREACQICQHFSPSGVDLIFGLIGVDLTRHVLLQAETPEGERILEALRLPEAPSEGREEVLSLVRVKKDENRAAFLERFQEECSGVDGLTRLFSACNNCHNCRVACPMCYCRECFLESSTFEWGASEYLAQAKRKGALRLPADTLLFHLTRLSHIGLFCVGCGLCQDACPNEIPLFSVFHSVGLKMQELFGYLPGRSIEEEPPLTFFKEDELSWVAQE